MEINYSTKNGQKIHFISIHGTLLNVKGYELIAALMS